MLAADMKLSERILCDTGETQERLVKGRVFAPRLRIESVWADRVTGSTETRDDLFTRDIHLLTLDDHALHFVCACWRRALTGRCRRGVLTQSKGAHEQRCD